MTITISPFVLGVIVTLASEFVAFIIYAIIYSVKTHRNASK
jgi:hypothetical protein